MRHSKIIIIIGLAVGGLLVGAAMHPIRAYALSNSSSGSTDTSSALTANQTPTTDTSGATDSNSTTSSTGPSTTTGAGTDTSAATSTDPTTATSAGSSQANSDSTTSADLNSTAANTTGTVPTISAGTNPFSDTTADPSTVSAPDSTVCSTPSSNSSSSDPTTDPSSGSSSTASNGAAINNCVVAAAQTGDASVTDSNLGGNATTGSASDIADIINALESASSLNSADLSTFIDNLTGNQTGDITLNPADFVGLTNSNTSSGPTDATNNNNGTINNTVNLTAASGNANVGNNQTGGNATTGNATTEANIINLLDAMLADNQAFLGIINIYGNLNGNILLPDSLVSGLLTNPTSGGSAPSNSSITNNLNVNNQVTLAAATGDATVSNNVNGGSATSGNATTSLNTYNLINSDIIGGNMLLVFVNVSGTWVGFLMNDPAGTTSAALGGQIQQYINQIPTTITSTNTETINNYVTLSSTTGNATVAYNFNGGNAVSGNATASADIVNIIGSNIDLSGWFGVLIINVFGNWTGSVGIVPLPPTTSNVVTSTAAPTPAISTPPSTAAVYSYYIFRASQTGGLISTSSINTGQGNPTLTHVALAHNNIGSTIKASNTNEILGILAVVLGVAMIALERLVTFRHNRKSI